MEPYVKKQLEEFASLHKQIADATVKLEILEKKNKGICKDYFQYLCKPVFENTPGLTSFSWKQYAPSWNDGDPCYFSAHTYDCDINGFSPYDDDDDDDEKKSKPVDFKALQATVRTFLDQFTSAQLEHWFGDGKEVIVTKDALEIEDYYSE
jgi:hypothetical protein